MFWPRKNTRDASTPQVEPHVFQDPPAAAGQSVRCFVCRRLETDPVHRAAAQDAGRWGL